MVPNQLARIFLVEDSTLEDVDALLIEVVTSLLDGFGEPILSTTVSSRDPLLVLDEQELKGLADAFNLRGHLLAHPHGSFHVLSLVGHCFLLHLLVKVGLLLQLLVLFLQLLLSLLHLSDDLQRVVNQLYSDWSLLLTFLRALYLLEPFLGGLKVVGQPCYLLPSLHSIIWNPPAKLPFELHQFLLMGCL